MSTVKQWDLLPRIDFEDRRNWRSLGQSRYGAFRARLLVVQSDRPEPRFGPIIAKHNVATGDTITLKRRRERILNHTETIREAIRFTATSQICETLSAKVAAEIALKVPGFSGSVKSALESGTSREFRQETERVLDLTSSHSVQELDATEHVIELRGQGSAREAQIRRRFWPRQWDFYLHSFEYLELTYRTKWLWRQVRESMRKADSGVVGWPLVRLVFYEPQPDVDVCYGAVSDELENPESIEVLELSAGMPLVRPSAIAPLEEIAKIAFPITRSEQRLAAKKKVAKMKAARKTRARRTVAKRQSTSGARRK